MRSGDIHKCEQLNHIVFGRVVLTQLIGERPPHRQARSRALSASRSMQLRSCTRDRTCGPSVIPRDSIHHPSLRLRGRPRRQGGAKSPPRSSVATSFASRPTCPTFTSMRRAARAQLIRSPSAGHETPSIWFWRRIAAACWHLGMVFYLLQLRDCSWDLLS